MSSSDNDDSSNEFTDAERKKIHLTGCKAEQQILETFITHVPAPSLAQCEDAIKWKDNTTPMASHDPASSSKGPAQNVTQREIESMMTLLEGLRRQHEDAVDHCASFYL